MDSRIDPRLEESVRRLCGHALRAELEEFTHGLNRLVTDDMFRDAMTLTYRIATVVTINLCDNQEPAADDLRRIADQAVDVDGGEYGLKPEEVRDFIARVLFAGEPLDSVMEPEDAARLPFIITANLLASTSDFDNGESWYDYLDKVETTIEAACDLA